MDHQYISAVDDKEAEVMFLLKSQLRTTKGQLLFHSWITYFLNWIIGSAVISSGLLVA